MRDSERRTNVLYRRRRIARSAGHRWPPRRHRPRRVRPDPMPGDGCRPAGPWPVRLRQPGAGGGRDPDSSGNEPRAGDRPRTGEAKPTRHPSRRRRGSPSATTAVALLDRPSGRKGRSPTRAATGTMRRGAPAGRRALRACHPRPGPSAAARPMRCASPSGRTTRTPPRPRPPPGVQTRAPSATPRRTRNANFAPPSRPAATPDALEAAARDWLTEINRINTDAREATATASASNTPRGGDRGDPRTAWASRPTPPGSAPRTPMPRASPRASAVADCDERPAEVPATAILVPPAAAAASGPPRLDDDETLGARARSGGSPADLPPAARRSRRRWRRWSRPRGRRSRRPGVAGRLRSPTSWSRPSSPTPIEASALDFPNEHPFWGPFTRSRTATSPHALSSLGYRFDGLGGWTDGRQPSQRDLSLALGYAGLDPMRVRHWPTEEQTARFVPRRRGRRRRIPRRHRRRPHAGGDGRRCSAVAPTGWPRSGTTGDAIRPLLLEETLSQPQPGPSSSSSSMTTSRRPRQRSPRSSRPPRPPISGSARRAHRGRGSAGVRAERVDLAVERGRDVHPGVGPVRPEEVDAADPVRRRARLAPATGRPSGCARPGRRRRRPRSPPPGGRCG